jgi:hypothetical protein
MTTTTPAEPLVGLAPDTIGDDGPKSARHRRRRQHRFGLQLWTLLHARALLDRPATAAASPGLIHDSYWRIEDDYWRLSARRDIG